MGMPAPPSPKRSLLQFVSSTTPTTAWPIGPFPIAPLEANPVASTEPPEYYFALATPDKVMVKSSTLASHPSIWIPRAAKQALNLLRLELIDRSASRA